jgi:hypothetical protein
MMQSATKHPADIANMILLFGSMALLLLIAQCIPAVLSLSRR